MIKERLLETVFSIAICHQLGDKWQSKALFLTIFDLRSLIVLTFLIAAYPVSCKGFLQIQSYWFMFNKKNCM